MQRATVILLASCLLLGCVLPAGAMTLQEVLRIKINGAPAPMGRFDADPKAGRAEVEPTPRRRRKVVTAAGVLDEPHTTYVLASDVTAAGTAFFVRADHVTLDLAGHTVVYNQSEPGEGVNLDKWWLNDVEVVNGVIRQGAARSAGDVHGRGANPIFSLSAENLVLAGLHLQWSGRDVAGIFVRGSRGVHIHHSTLVDDGDEVTNRHQTIEAVNVNGEDIEIDHVLIDNARQVGIFTHKANVHHNEIRLESKASNSSGIRVKHGRIADNLIIGRGENPVGIWPGPGTKVHSNYVEVQNTARSSEYGSTGAAGLRIAWGKSDNIEVFCNTFVVRAEKNLLGGGLDSWGRGLFIGVPNPKQSAYFHHNLIAAVNAGRGAKAAAVGIVANNDSPGLVLEDNVIASNWGLVLLGDDYGSAGGFPVLRRNRLVRIGDPKGFSTFLSQYRDYASTALLVDNVYEDGASPADVSFELPSKAPKELRFARAASVRVRDAGERPVSGAGLRLFLPDGTLLGSAVTGTDGRAELPVVTRRLVPGWGGALREVEPERLLLEVSASGRIETEEIAVATGSLEVVAP